MLRLCYRSLLWIGLLTSSSFLYAKEPSAEERLTTLFLKMGIKMEDKLSKEDYKKIEAEKIYRKKLLFTTLLLKGIEILCWLPMYHKLYQTYQNANGGTVDKKMDQLANVFLGSRQGIYLLLYVFIPLVIRHLLHFYFPMPFYVKKGKEIYKAHIEFYQGNAIVGEWISWAMALFCIMSVVFIRKLVIRTSILSAIGGAFSIAGVLAQPLALWVAFLVYPLWYCYTPILNDEKKLLLFKNLKKGYVMLDKERNALKAKCPDAARLLKVHDLANWVEKLTTMKYFASNR